ncbi:hypothetical protein HHK36_018798 [Tetracentron sinense]|uniref:Uncharacterized protein n=1 Tax=Tetracentron sinense TaxID=13715 RepID=A0A835D9E9_TETSI|nr:hypothetical protein HHK36_018798 [Tetracentron sinense]
MVKRRLYRCTHPIDAYPFEAFSCGSWNIVELVRIRGGDITMHFKDPGFESEEKVPIMNLRMRSRKATLSDCTCFLRPGIDICVLSPSPSSESIGQGSLNPVWIDAKISSIERKPHESRCTCQFYINYYITQDPLGTEKTTLSSDIEIVEIENIAILQQLDRKPCEDEYYRWSSSKDCPSTHEAKLFRGQFSSDVSWLLVTSIWSQIGFAVRSIQNKMIYQILGGDQEICPRDSDKNANAINFRLDNGILRPNTKHFDPVVPFVPVDTYEVGPVHDMREDGSMLFYDLTDLRRSKRRNVQPERFFSYGGFSEAMLNQTETNRWRKKETYFAMSTQTDDDHLIHTHYSQTQIGGEKMVHVSLGDSSRRAHQTRLSENHENVVCTTAFKKPVGEGLFGKVSCSMRVPEQRKKTAKCSMTNHAVYTFTGMPLPAKSDPLRHQPDHLHVRTPGIRVGRISKVSSKHNCANGGPMIQIQNISKGQHRKVESRWKVKGSHKKIQRSNYYFGSKRERFCETRTDRRRFLSASECKEMVERCMKNIESEIKKEHPLAIAQWEAIQATNPLNQSRGCDWISLVNVQPENLEIESMWVEMELSMAAIHFLEDSQASTVEFSNDVVCSPSKGGGQSCQHEYKVDEEIGIICQLCGFVSTEIRDISPPFLRATGWITNKELCDEEDLECTEAEHGDLDLFCHPTSSKDMSLSEGNDNVWALIPELKRKLHLHQKKAFEFLWSNIAGSLVPALMKPASKRRGGCVISHSPGAGKTLLIIAFLVSYLKLFPGKRPLVLAPKTTLYTWYKEIKKWDISIPVYQIDGRKNYENEIHNQTLGEFTGERKPNRYIMHVMDCLEKIHKWHSHPSVLLMGYTSFLMLMREDSKLKHRRYMGKVLRQSPGILILDEGHNPRSTRSRLRKALMKVKTELRILLSGTLFQNNFREYFNTLCLARPKFISEVLRKLDPKVNRNRKGAKSTGVLAETRARRFFIDKIAKKINSSITEDRIQGLNMLRNMTNGFIDVYESGSSETLPGLHSYTLLMKSTTIQKEILSKLQRHNVAQKRYPLELELLITLGSIHPCLIKTVACVTKYFGMDKLEQLEKHRFDIRKGSKVRFVVSLVHGCIVKGEKVLIFCRNIAPINLFVEIFEMIFGWRKGEEVLVLQGDQELFERGRVIDKFEEPGGASKVLLASITACSEGISLTAASRVVLLDSEWNPSKTRQAIARAFRPGQERVVYVYQLLAHGTLEEDKYGRTTWKEWVSRMIFNEDLVEDPSDRQAENIEDDVLREIVALDRAKSFHMIMKNEKVSNGLVRGKELALFSPK